MCVCVCECVHLLCVFLNECVFVDGRGREKTAESSQEQSEKEKLKRYETAGRERLTVESSK